MLGLFLLPLSHEVPSMSDHPSVPPLDAPVSGRSRTRSLLALGLLLLSIGGIAMLQFRSDYALTYWLVMVPIFGVVNAVGAWPHTREPGARRGDLIRRLVLHWAALGLAVTMIVFLMRGTTLTGEVAGLLAALLLALTCFLAGVHFDWHFLVLGGVLGLTVAGGAFAEQYFWIALVLAVIAVVVIGYVRRRN